MKRSSALCLLILATLAICCGSSSGNVLERIEEIEPPGSNLRVDVFVVLDVSSCAIGEPCRSTDLNQCFYLTHSAGDRLPFRPETLQFVPPGSPAIAQAEQAACFRVGFDAASLAAVDAGFSELRQLAFQLSEGEVHLDVRFHPVGPIDAGFKRWENRTGIFLQPTALEGVGLPLLSRETDFIFAVTGIVGIGSSPLPKVDECAGTNWQEQGGLGGTAYTWVSAPCLEPARLLRHFLIQSYFALRDVEYFPDIYAGPDVFARPNYPPCGRGDPDTRRWFPRPEDCAIDPDWASCGNGACRTNDPELAFEAHVLTAHWQKGRQLNGNHCENGKVDYGETSTDAGGVCDLLGR